MKIITLSLTGCLLASSALASTTVFNPPDGFWLSPHVYNHTLYGPSTPNGTSSHWDVTQWSQWNGDFAAFTGATTNNLSGTITFGSPWQVLTARGFWNSSTKIPCGVEYDVFMQPIDAAYPTYPQGAVSLPYLSAISDLTHSISFDVLGSVNEENTCPVTQAFAQTSFIFSNTNSHQTFYYQIELFKSASLQGGDLWWATGSGGTYGYTIPINYIVGGNLPSLNAHEYDFNFNFLPNVEAAISYAAAHYGMDGNVAHWQITSAFTGQAIWGRYNLNVEYKNWTLTY